MSQLLKTLLSEYPYISLNIAKLKTLPEKDWKRLSDIDSRFSTIQNDIRIKKITK